MSEAGEFLKKPQIVHLNWYGSKDYLSGYLQPLAPRTFMDGMIYDLGHVGRGFDDFGKDIIIQCNRAKFLDRSVGQDSKLEAYMKFGKFFGIISVEIDKFIGDRRGWKREREALRGLVETRGEQQIVLTFDSPWGPSGRRALESIREAD